MKKNKRSKSKTKKNFNAPWWKFFFVIVAATFIAIPLSEEIGLNLYSTGDVAGTKTSNLIALGGCQGGEEQCPTPSPLPKIYRVYGKVLNNSGKRPMGAAMQVQLGNSYGLLKTTYSSPRTGVYSFKKVENGSYWIRVSCSADKYIVVFNSAKKVPTIYYGSSDCGGTSK